MAEREDFVTTTNTTVTSDASDLGGGRDSDRIRSEINRTRSNMDETFAALDAKLTPSQIGLEVWNLFKGGSSAGASKLWRIAKEHPMPAAVIGLGLGWLLVESSKEEEDRTSYRVRGEYSDYGYGRPSYAGAAGTRAYTSYESRDYGYDEYDEEGGRLAAAKDKVKDVAESAKDAVSGAAHRVGDVASSAKDRVSDLGHRVTDRASDLKYRTKDRAVALKGQAGYKARQAKLGFWQKMEENPLMVGAATLALGVIAGLSIPATRKENELMGETRDRLFEEVKETGQEVLEKGKHVAEAVADKVKTEAQGQGLTPETVVSNVADKVRTVAKEAVNTAKEEAKRQDLTPNALKGQGQDQGQPAVTHEHEPELVKP
jgi:gas vesicle protein